MHRFPSGITLEQFDDELVRLERVSRLAGSHKNFFDEGLHLISTADMPWGDDVRERSIEAYVRFIHGETWMTGGGAREMEAEIVAWMGALLGAPAATGFVTSGGSESNMCAVLAAIEGRGRLRGGSVVFPANGHYSLHKLCAMFGLEPIVVPSRAGSYCDVDPDAVADAIRPDTVAVIATAGTWAFGTVDPIAEIGEITARRGIHLHVDAAFGGYILPFLERAGYDATIPAWDFRVPGVCSISADLHKNGMAPPPASTLFFRDADLLAQAKAICPPNGTISGTRGAGPIAGAWAMVRLLGDDGYRSVALSSMGLRDEIVAGVERIEGLRVHPDSKINMALIWSDWVDLRSPVEVLRDRGWMFSARTVPPPVSVVVVPMPHNDGQVEPFLADLAECVERAEPLDPAATDRQHDVSTYGF